MIVRPNKKLAVLGIWLSLLALLVGVSTNAIPRSRAQTLPTSVPTTLPSPAFAAMEYYDTNCAHCHGPQGSFYGPTLGQDLTDGQLQKAVDAMASGAGNSPLAADQLPVETAFHRALIMRKPFLSVTQMGDDGQWAGEAMPDSKVIIHIGKQEIEATSDDYNWTAQVPRGTKPLDVTITAVRKGATTTLLPAEATYSNQTAIPPVAQRPK
jgi:hypothetical protein